GSGAAGAYQLTPSIPSAVSGDGSGYQLPSALPQTLVAHVGVAGSINLSTKDPYGNPIVWSIVSATNGTATMAPGGGQLSFTPAPGFFRPCQHPAPSRRWLWHQHGPGQRQCQHRACGGARLQQPQSQPPAGPELGPAGGRHLRRPARCGCAPARRLCDRDVNQP